MSDEELEKLWENNQPEDFAGWQEGKLNFKRPPKKLIQLRLDPKDVRIIDRESKESTINNIAIICIMRAYKRIVLRFSKNYKRFNI